MAIDTEAIKEHVRGILVALGDDPEREGLKETPERVAKMYEEAFEGMNYTNHEIAQMFDKTFDQDLELPAKVTTWSMSEILKFSAIVNIIWHSCMI